MKENKGITLVALIITIIVLLILAIVTISAVNEGSLFAHANNAATKYDAAAREENTMVSDYLSKLKQYSNEKEPNEYGFYYNMPYVLRDQDLWTGQQVDTVSILQIDTNNNVYSSYSADTNYPVGTRVHRIGDGFGEYLVTESGGNTEFVIENIAYNTEYTGYNSLRLPVTVWFDESGDINMKYNLPGSIINIDKETRTIDVANGTASATYSADGKSVSFFGNTFVLEQ